jgi:hypothetical protein
VTDEQGNPLVVYHGTGNDFQNFDLSMSSPEGTFGPGFYHTENPDVAAGYAATGTVGLNPSAGLAPQIRPAKLAIHNPFDVAQAATEESAMDLVGRLEGVFPNHDWDRTRQAIRSGMAQYSNLQIAPPDANPFFGPQAGDVLQYTNHELYNTIAATPLKESVDIPESQVLGRGALNSGLEAAGYDGIVHSRTVGKLWVAFRPEQVHSPWDVQPLDVKDAAIQGDALAKQATVLESPTLPEAIGRVKISDADVVQAAQASNPGGASLVRGLSRASDLAGASNIQFIQRGNVFDALVNGTPQQATELKNFGVFTGQKVVTASGIEGSVKGFTKKGLITVSRQGGVVNIRPENLLPSRFGAPMEAPQLWDNFHQDLMSYMNTEAASAGMAPVESVTDPRVASVIAERSADFMDRQGISDPGLRQALDAHFNENYVQAFKDLDPEMQGIQTEATTAALDAQTASEESANHNLPTSMEEKAEKRGFVWVSYPGEGGTLMDAVNPGTPDIPMASDAAAHEFLARADRALPDHTIISDVPMDVAENLPTDLGQEPAPVWDHYVDQVAEATGRSREELEQLNSPEGQQALAERLLGTDADVRAFRTQVGLGTSGPGLGGAGFSPPPPPPPTLPPSGGGPQALPPGPRETLGAQFAKLQRSDPAKLHQLVYDFEGLMSSRIRYMRYAMLNLETRLKDAGIDLGRAWAHYDDLDTARSLAFNEGTPWIHEWGQITRDFPRRTLRDGTVTRIHEIEDPNARAAAWWRTQDSHGLTDRQVRQALRGDERITDFMHRFFEHLTGDPAWSLTADREIFRYMPHVRARQAQGSPNAYDTGSLSSEAQFFGEYARDGNLQFRIMDARELGNHMVRSAMFKKFEAEPWRQLVEAWQDPRVPQYLQDFMLDWARIVRYGYDPRGELAVRAIQSVAGRMLKTPMTAREAQHLLNMPTGAMYMSMLAGRTSIFFRDALQPFLALAKVRVPYMVQVWGKIAKGVGQRLSKQDENDYREMYMRGLQGGWIERENPNIEAASIYEEPGGTRENELLHLTDPQAARREALARVLDKTYQLPNWLIRPQQSNVSTLKWYGRQGQLHRLITGESAYQQSKDMLGQYRAAELESVMSGGTVAPPDYGKFADRSFFSSFEQPIQRRLREMVDAGDDEGASELFAREVSNWSQFRYGRREVPPILRGNIGRALFMFGNFTGQFLEAAASSLANGTPYQKSRYLMTIGAVSGLMYELKHLTGWSFNRFAWVPQAFQYAGSPLLEKGARAVAAFTGGMNRASGYPASEFEKAAIQEEIRGGLLPSTSDFFPYTGYIRSGAELMNAAQGMNPTMQAARYIVTGDRTSRIDWARTIEEMARQQEAGGHLQPGVLSPNGGQMPGYEPPVLDPQGHPIAPYNPTHHPDSLGPQGSGAMQ